MHVNSSALWLCEGDEKPYQKQKQTDVLLDVEWLDDKIINFAQALTSRMNIGGATFKMA